MANVAKKYKDEYRKRAAELVAKMTLEEKVSQMLHEAGAIERLGIKAHNWWNEALHGVARAGTATVFPQAIALGATFDEELIERVGDAVSTEARAKYNIAQRVGDTNYYKGLTFWSPNVNIFRDARWGRGHETYGEDPYLTSRLGVAYIKGLQGYDEKYLKSAACAKHFCAHSGPESLRHEFNALVSDQDLNETYLPAFEACVKEAEVEGVMGAYNRTNGEVCCGSPTLLRGILRNKWGFEGYMTSDCEAVRYFHEYHKVTSEPKYSVTLAISNACDLNCGCTYKHVITAVNEGILDEKFVDESVIRLLTTRMKLGEFDNPEDVPYSKIPYSVVDCPEHKALNLEASKKSLVLLENKNSFLPLDKSKVKTVGVIGPNANSIVALHGNYQGTASKYITVCEGIQNIVENNGGRVLYSVGCHLYKDADYWCKNDRFDEVVAICEQSDVVVACFGLDELIEGEKCEGDTGLTGDKKDLRLPGLQSQILAEITKRAKHTVVVILAGSAMDISEEAGDADAIIQGWYPGAQGGRAIAELIFGEFSPEGKLPITIYKDGQQPEFADYSMEGRTYRYMKEKPLYPFGYGLSYVDFEISDVTVSTTQITEKGVDVSLKVKNTGKMDAGEAIQIYIKAEREKTPNAQLKAIKKVFLRAGEEKSVTVALDASAFTLCDENGERRLEAGNYTIYVGDSQPDARSIELTGKAPHKISVCV